MPLSLSSIIDYILLFGHNTPTNDTIPEAETLKDLSSGEGISEFCVTLLAGWLISLSANLSLGVFFCTNKGRVYNLYLVMQTHAEPSTYIRQHGLGYFMALREMSHSICTCMRLVVSKV